MGAIELGAYFQVWEPSGVDYYSLNNTSDPNFVGYVDDISGLDSPGIRENAQVKSAGMGGYHGPFWFDRRPWSISGTIMPVMPLSARSASQDKIASIMAKCLQADGSLQWLPASAPDGSDVNWRTLPFRYQQSFRSTKGQSNVNRTFMVAGVAADWRILAGADTSIQFNGPLSASSPFGDPASLSNSATNQGDALAAPQFTVNGPINGPYIYNATTATGFYVNTQLAFADTLVIDMWGTFPSVTHSSGLGQEEETGFVDSGLSDWNIGLAPGNNDWQLWEVGPRYTGSWAAVNSWATALKVDWFDSWV